MTGDLLDRQHFDEVIVRQLRRFLKGLSARLGVYVILGNHDGDLIGVELAKIESIRFVDGRVGRLIDDSNEATLDLIGLPGVWRTDAFDGFLKHVPARKNNSLRIVLSHYPDQILKMDDLQHDLFFAGHTHGGQVCFPNGSPVITHDALPKRFAKGVFKWGSSYLIVNRGCGFGSPMVRAFCSTEVIEVRLKRE